MKVEFPVYLENIADAIGDAVSGEISEIDGVGNDGDSVYEVTDVSVEERDGQYVVIFEMERTSGKFAAKDDIQSAILDNLSGIEVTVNLESAL